MCNLFSLFLISGHCGRKKLSPVRASSDPSTTIPVLSRKIAVLRFGYHGDVFVYRSRPRHQHRYRRRDQSRIPRTLFHLLFVLRRPITCNGYNSRALSCRSVAMTKPGSKPWIPTQWYREEQRAYELISCNRRLWILKDSGVFGPPCKLWIFLQI